MRIDIHSHFMSQKMAHAMEKFVEYPYTRFVDGRYCYYWNASAPVPMMPTLIDLEKKIEDMDSAGIDVSVLSLSVPGPERVGGSKADELARMVNDELAEIIARHPKRFWGYATLGFGNIDASLSELERCFTSLGFRGLGLYSNINGKPLDSAEFRPIIAQLAEYKRPTFVHPTMPINQSYLMDLIPAPVLAFTVDTTMAGMRLAMAGVLSDYSAAPIIIPHLGGTIPFLMGRLDGWAEFLYEGKKLPGELLKSLYFDTVAYRPQELKYTLSVMGADHLLLGTDYPYGQWRAPIKLLDEIDISAAQAEKVLYGNAERLFA